MPEYEIEVEMTFFVRKRFKLSAPIQLMAQQGATLLARRTTLGSLAVDKDLTPDGIEIVSIT